MVKEAWFGVRVSRD